MDFGRENSLFPLILIQVKSAAKRTVFGLKDKREKAFLPFKTQLFHIQVVRYAVLKRIKTMLLGDKIKELREEHGVLQRQLAALLDIDTPMFSKIERGDRYAKRTQVIQLAEYFNIDKNELLTLWLADKVLDAIEDEDELKRKAIEVAQERIG